MHPSISKQELEELLNSEFSAGLDDEAREVSNPIDDARNETEKLIEAEVRQQLIEIGPEIMHDCQDHVASFAALYAAVVRGQNKALVWDVLSKMSVIEMRFEYARGCADFERRSPIHSRRNNSRHLGASWTTELIQDLESLYGFSLDRACKK